MTLMNLPDLNLLQWTVPALPALVSLLCAFTCVILIVRRNRTSRHERDKMEKEQAQLRQDLLALLRCSAGMGKQLRAQQRELRRLGERQFQVERSDSSAPIRAAETLLENGAGSAEIAQQCGLSLSEAELMVHLEDLRQREARNAA